MVAKAQSPQKSGKEKNALRKFLKHFTDVTKDPHEYLSAQPERADKVRNILKDLYSWTVQKNDGSKHPEILPELVLDDMDEEQVWQQIEIYNDCTCPVFIEETSKLLSAKDQKFTVNLDANEDPGDDNENYEEEFDDDMPEEEEDFNEDFDEDGLEDDEDDEDDDDDDDEEKELADKKIKLKKKHRKTVVDDKFFKLGEMEEFLNMEDEKERQKDKKKSEDATGIDYFNDDLGDEDEENVNYKDFFEEMDDEEVEKDKQRKAKKQHDSISADEGLQQEEDDFEDGEAEDNPEAEMDNDFSEEEENDTFEQNKRPAIEQYSESEDDDDDEGVNADENLPKSSFESRQQRLKQRIEEYEEEALAEKPWQLKGEISATGRPQNSMLEEVLQFDSTVRPAPVITEETTMRLEDIIKQRIKNKVWDDVEKKVKTITTPQEYRKKIILDQEKSKESLAQIYEKEYQKELDKLDPNRDERVEEPKKHKEIKAMMRNLFIKLDALSNFHYTPKPVAPEVKIITNTPAVNMEEIAPVTMTNAKMLAPEDIKRRPKGDVLGKGERTKTDQNRERRKKKTKQRAIYKAKEQRDLEKQKLGIKLSTKEEKGKMLRTVMKSKNVKTMNKSNEGSLKSSKAFFTQLQDKTANKRIKQPKRSDTGELSAKKMKL